MKEPTAAFTSGLGMRCRRQIAEEPRFELASGLVGLKPLVDWKPEILRLPQGRCELRLGKEAAEVGEGSG